MRANNRRLGARRPRRYKRDIPRHRITHHRERRALKKREKAAKNPHFQSTGLVTPGVCTKKDAKPHPGLVALFKRHPAPETVNHPAHYGGDTPYEVLKVLRAWKLLDSFTLGNAIKYIARHRQKGTPLEDLKKARFYIDWAITEMEKSK